MHPYMLLHIPTCSHALYMPYVPLCTLYSILCKCASIYLHVLLCTPCAPMCPYMSNMYLIHTTTCPMCPYMPLRSPCVLLCTPIQTITSLFAPYMSLHVPYISHLHLQWSYAPLCASLCPYMPYIPYMLLYTPMCLLCTRMCLYMHTIHPLMTLHAPMCLLHVLMSPICVPVYPMHGSYTPVHKLYVHLTQILIGLWSPPQVFVSSFLQCNHF